MPPNDERFVLDSLESPEIPRVDDRFSLDQIEKAIELSPLEQFIGEENPFMREVARKGSSVLRGGSVPMLGARTAMMLPGTPLQKAIYGTVGGLGLPLAELGAIGLQKLGYDVGSPYEAIQKFYTDMGLPESQTDIEKDLEMFSASFAGVKDMIVLPSDGKNTPGKTKLMNNICESVLKELAVEMSQHHLPVQTVAGAVIGFGKDLMIETKDDAHGVGQGHRLGASSDEGNTGLSTRDRALAAAEKRAREAKEDK